MTHSRVVTIGGGGQSLAFALAGETPPAIVYWGPALKAADRLDAAALTPAVPQGMLDDGETFDCLPESGRGFTGHPAIRGHRESGAFVSQLAVTTVDETPSSARFRLEDRDFGITVDLRYAIDAHTGVLSIDTALTNTAAERLTLDWLAAAVLPSPHSQILMFDGRWAHEFATVRQGLSTGLLVKDNRTGRTSHHSPPFLFAGSPGFDEQRGDVLALHLAWSGNHRLLAERLRDGRMQLQAGELFEPGECMLDAGASYIAPTVYAALSDRGMNGISQRLHSFVRETVLGGRLRQKPRPVQFNSWEAVYFAQDQAVMMDLANRAARLGIERFVVDDGWFSGRNDDRAGLGDWTVDRHKYPDGLAPLIAHVHGLGMEFGLWVEPEMANRDLDLLRAHPDWILGLAGRAQPIGRHQYVLDLTRPEVFAAIFAQLDALLRDHAIDYLKWDMNRDLTHAASFGRPAASAQTRAVYALIDKLRATHRDVEIESCSSGGGRADYAILARTDRVWVSDCNDPIERQAIQRGYSIAFPPETMGAHVGPRRSHTTARSASLQMRALTAMFGHMGVEGDIRAFSDAELDELAQWIARHKALRPILHAGTLHRIAQPDPGMVAFAIVAGDAVVSAAQIATQPYGLAMPLRIPGLDAGGRYRVRLLNPPAHPARTMKRVPPHLTGEPVELEGQVLAARGITLPVLHAGQVAVFHLEREA